MAISPYRNVRDFSGSASVCDRQVRLSQCKRRYRSPDHRMRQARPASPNPSLEFYPALTLGAVASVIPGADTPEQVGIGLRKFV